MEHLLRATAEAEVRHFWFRGFRAFVLPLIQRVAPTPARILTAAAGLARTWMLSRFGEMFGFDLSPVRIAHRPRSARTRLVRATVTAVPFPDSAFDVVTSFDVLYSLEEPQERAAVAEMFRLTVPAATP